MRPIRASLTSRMHTAVPDSTYSGRSRHNRHAKRQARVHSIHIQTTGGTLAAHAVMRVLCRSPCQVLALSGARLVRCSRCGAPVRPRCRVVSASGTGTRADRASGIRGTVLVRFLELAYTNVTYLVNYGFTDLPPSSPPPPPSHTLPDPGAPRSASRHASPDTADARSSVLVVGSVSKSVNRI